MVCMAYGIRHTASWFVWRLQLALVGTSVRKDVIELLEKRVRSRFSHQCLLVPEAVHLPSPPTAEARSSRRTMAAPAPADAPLAVLASMLSLPAGPASAVSPMHAAYAARFNAAADAAVSAPAVLDILMQRCGWVSHEAQGEIRV